MRESAGRPGVLVGALAVEAFFYGFPLVFDLERGQAGSHVEGIGAVPATPYNEFGHRPPARGPRDQVRFGQQRPRLLDRERGRERRPRPSSRCPTPGVAATFSSSSTRGRTTSPTSASARLAPRPGSFLLVGRDEGEVSAWRTRDPLPDGIATIVGARAVDGEYGHTERRRAPDSSLTLTPAAPGNRGARWGSSSGRGAAPLEQLPRVDGELSRRPIATSTYQQTFRAARPARSAIALHRL